MNTDTIKANAHGCIEDEDLDATVRDLEKSAGYLMRYLCELRHHLGRLNEDASLSFDDVLHHAGQLSILIDELDQRVIAPAPVKQ